MHEWPYQYTDRRHVVHFGGRWYYDYGDWRYIVRLPRGEEDVRPGDGVDIEDPACPQVVTVDAIIAEDEEGYTCTVLDVPLSCLLYDIHLGDERVGGFASRTDAEAFVAEHAARYPGLRIEDVEWLIGFPADNE